MLPIDAFYTILQYDDNIKYRALNSGIKCIHEKLILNFDLVFCLENNVIDITKQYKKAKSCYEETKSEYNEIKSYAKSRKLIKQLLKLLKSNADSDLVEHITSIKRFEFTEHESHSHNTYTISYDTNNNSVDIGLSQAHDLNGSISLEIEMGKTIISEWDRDLYINSSNKREKLISFTVMFMILELQMDYEVIELLDCCYNETMYDFLPLIPEKDIHEFLKQISLSLSFRY
jgi:hypothetical protein